MPIFKPIVGTKSQVQARDVKDGSYYVTSDTGQLFIDLNNTRHHINSLDADDAVVNTLKQSYAELGIVVVDQNQILASSQKKITLDQESSQVSNDTLTIG